MKKVIIAIVSAALLVTLVVPCEAKKKTEPVQKPKYVFYFIGDGMGINHVFGTELYNAATGYQPEQVNFFHFPVRTIITTFSANSKVTDSAAAGTALSTGNKTNNSSMGVDKDNNPVSSVAEWAKEAGFGTGVATSVGVNHATPAAFYSHSLSRNNYEEIAEQLAVSPLDFAAGCRFLNQEKKTGHNSEYLEELQRKAGRAVLRGAELKSIASHEGRVVCLNANPDSEDDLPYALDRKNGDTQLSDFVQAGVDYLYAKYAEKGFFFMIEGGSIDHFGHNNDGAGDFAEINDMARNVDIALAFYDQHPDETLIVVTADHETGGMYISGSNIAYLACQRYSENTLTAKFRELYTDPSGNGAAKVLSWEEVKEFLSTELGLWRTVKVDQAAEDSFKASYERMFIKGENEEVVSLYAVNTKLISDAIDYLNNASGISFRTGSHSGSPLGLYVKGVGQSEFLNCQDNTDVPKMIAKIAGYR